MYTCSGETTVQTSVLQMAGTLSVYTVHTSTLRMFATWGDGAGCTLFLIGYNAARQSVGYIIILFRAGQMPYIRCVTRIAQWRGLRCCEVVTVQPHHTLHTNTHTDTI